jgi:hypothetical protein
MSCDSAFVISYKGNDPVIVCPFCAEELPYDESIDFDDSDSD